MNSGHVSPYRILEKLGEGGMGVVYLAEDARLGRQVALKFLPPTTTVSEEDRKRFEQEARAAARLNHPHICTVYAFDEYEGRPVIAMEYVEGATLQEKMRSGALPIDEALDYAAQIAEALAKAHEAGIVHRDVKPGNVMLTGDGRIKVMDFGLAKLRGADPITRTGSTIGTMAYMAPEQIQGQEVDHRADVFAFGVLLFEMLTGLRPFRGEHEAALVYSIVNEKPARASLLRNELPTAFDDILAKALARDPADRYQDVRLLVSDLDRAAKEGERRPLQIDAMPPHEPPLGADREAPASVSGSSGLPARTGFRVPAMIAAAAIVVVGAVAFYMAGTLSADAPAGPLSLSQLTFHAGLEEYPAWSPDGARLAFSRETNGYRNIVVKDLATGSEQQVTDTRADNIQAAWSPDGSTLLFVRANDRSGRIDLGDLYASHVGGDVWLLDLEAMEERHFLADAFNPSFSPDGQWVAVDASWAGSRRLWMVDGRGRNPRQISHDVSEDVGHIIPRWSPDGSRIAFQHIEGPRLDIRMIDRSTEEIIRLTDDHFPNVQPYWSHADDRIYFSSYRGGGMNIWRLRVTGSPPRATDFEQVTTGAGEDLNIAVSPDGRRIAFAVLGINSNIWALPVSPETGLPTGDPRPLIETTREDSRGAWSPDGSMVAFNSDRGGDMNLWLLTIEDGSVRQLTRGPGGDYQPDWSPDGAWITFFSSRGGHLNIWRVEVATGEMQQLTNRPAIDINPFYSPDGRHIAFHSAEMGRREPWVMRSDGAELRRLAVMPASGHFLRWAQEADAVIVARFRGPSPGLWVIPLEYGDPVFLVEPAGGAHISFSPDHTMLMDVIGHDELWVTPLDGREPYPVFTFDDTPDTRIDYPVWSRDGRHVLFDRHVPAGGNIWLAQGF